MLKASLPLETTFNWFWCPSSRANIDWSQLKNWTNAVVLKNVPDNHTFVGIPARKVESQHQKNLLKHMVSVKEKLMTQIKKAS